MLKTNENIDKEKPDKFCAGGCVFVPTTNTIMYEA